MSRPGGQRPRLAVLLRSLADRFALGLLVGLSVLLLLLGKADMKLANLAAEHLNDAAVPVLELLNRPVAAIRTGFDRVGALLAVYDENARLREENRRLLGLAGRGCQALGAEPGLAPHAECSAVADAPSWTTARIIADSGGVFVRTLLVDAGADQDVAVGMPALTPQGLVGRVVDAGRRSARILLVTDFNSKIPVVVESSGDQAILEGDKAASRRCASCRSTPSLAGGRPGADLGTWRDAPAGADGRSGRQHRRRQGCGALLVDWSRLDYLSLLHYDAAATGARRPMADRSGWPRRERPRHAAPLLSGIVAVCIDVLPLPNPAPSRWHRS